MTCIVIIMDKSLDAWGIPLNEAAPEPRRASDVKLDKEGGPQFFFGRTGHNEWQHSDLAKDLKDDAGDFKYRTGFAYGNLPMRIKLFLERFGDPDFVHAVASYYPRAATVHAIFFEKGKDMIHLWDRGDIRSEYQWKMFERQAKENGYSIKRFSKGSIEDSRGYWLD